MSQTSIQGRSGSYFIKSDDLASSHISNNIDRDILYLSDRLGRHAIYHPEKPALVQMWNSNPQKDSFESLRYDARLNNLRGFLLAHNESRPDAEKIALQKENAQGVSLHASVETLWDFIMKFKYN